ncbi:MAG: type II toxin-antitoxin system RelE/ParE family toxin [Gemmatimonadota bacterium]
MYVRWLTPARLEFLEAVDFYEARTPGLGADFIDEIERAVGNITANPRAGLPLEGNTRRVLLRRFPFSLIYEAQGDQALVVAVAHHSRKPGYWRDRR